MGDAAAVKRPPTRQVHLLRGRGGIGKSTQIKLLAERLAGAGAPSSPASPAARPAPRSSAISCCRAWQTARPGCQTLLFAAARDDHVRTVIQPRSVRARGAAPLRSDPRLSGRLGNVAPGAQRHAARHHGDPAGSDHHPRRARGSRPQASGGAARRVSPTASSPRTSPTRICATLIGRSRRKILTAAFIDASASPDARQPGVDRCATICLRWRARHRRHERPQTEEEIAVRHPRETSELFVIARRRRHCLPPTAAARIRTLG